MIPGISDYPRRTQMRSSPSCLLPDASSQVPKIVWGFSMGPFLKVIMQTFKTVRLIGLKFLSALAIEHHRSTLPKTPTLLFSYFWNVQRASKSLLLSPALIQFYAFPDRGQGECKHKHQQAKGAIPMNKTHSNPDVPQPEDM